MTHAAYHHKLRGDLVEGSLICTLQMSGCDNRHGPPVRLNTELGFKPCPSCIQKQKERAGMTQKETRYARLKKRELVGIEY